MCITALLNSKLLTEEEIEELKKTVGRQGESATKRFTSKVLLARLEEKKHEVETAIKALKMLSKTKRKAKVKARKVSAPAALKVVK